MKAVPQNEQLEIFALIDAGKSNLEIERITGRTQRTIKRYRRIGNRPSLPPGQPQKLSYAERERIALRVKANPHVTRGAIAQSESISTTYLGKILREFGIPLKAPRMEEATLQRFLDAYLNTTEPVSVLCARFQRTTSQLYALLRTRNLPSRKPGRSATPVTISPEDADLLRMYAGERASYAKIAERIGRSASCVRSRIIRYRRSRSTLAQFTAAQVGTMVADYLAGSSLATIAKKHRCCSLRVRAALRNAGCELRPRGFACRYQLKHDFFVGVSTEEAPAYWCGYAEADFYVDAASDRHLSWTIKADDVGHMKRFMTEIGHHGHLKIWVNKVFPSRRQFTLVWTSRGHSRDLRALGIVSRSLEQRTFPAHLGKEALRHYLRGFLDGDGSWGTDGTTLRVSFYAASKYLSELRAWLHAEFGLRLPKIVQHRGICRITYNGKDADLIASYVYEGATVYLDRKRRVALRLR